MGRRKTRLTVTPSGLAAPGDSFDESPSLPHPEPRNAVARESEMIAALRKVVMVHPGSVGMQRPVHARNARKPAVPHQTSAAKSAVVSAEHADASVSDELSRRSLNPHKEALAKVDEKVLIHCWPGVRGGPCEAAPARVAWRQRPHVPEPHMLTLRGRALRGDRRHGCNQPRVFRLAKRDQFLAQLVREERVFAKILASLGAALGDALAVE